MRCLLLLVFVSTPLAAQGGVSAKTAFHLSLWSTVVPVAAGAAYWLSQENPVPGDPFYGPDRVGPSLVMAGGFVIGPVIGYSAAGLSGRGWKGVGLRAGLTLVSIAPAMAICGWDCTKGDSGYDVAWLVLATGTGLSAASAVYDIARVKHNVRQQRSREQGAGSSFAPFYVPGGRIGLTGQISF